MTTQRDAARRSDATSAFGHHRDRLLCHLISQQDALGAGPETGRVWLVLLMFAVAAGIGWQVAVRVQMTEMPQLVAALHSFV